MDSELAEVADSLPALIWTACPDGQMVFLNRRWCDYTGQTRDDARGRGWQSAVHPEDLPGLLAGWRQPPSPVPNPAPMEADVRLRGADGHDRWFAFCGRPVADASGQIVEWSGVSTDIDARVRGAEALRAGLHRSEALLAGERRLLEMVAGGRPMRDILRALCQLVEATASGSSCSIVLLDPAGAALQEAIAPSIAAEFNDAVRGWPLQRVGGPCVMAARDKVQVIMPDVATDTRWRNGWRALAQQHGLRSCWSTPIVSLAGQVLGTFALYQREPGSPDARQRELIAQFTHIASIAIEGAQRDAALRQSEAHLAGEKQLLEMIAAGRPLLDVLDALCRFFEQASPDWHCGVYPIEWRGPTFQYGVAPSLPPSYTAPIAGLRVGRDVAPCGIAADEKTQVIVEDIGADPRWKHTSYCTHVLDHGLRAVWSTPICSRQGRVLGTFCIYRRTPGRPSAHHQNLIAHATHIASIAIERSLAEDALRRSETLLAEGQRLSLTGTYSWPMETDELTFSEQLRRTFELEPEARVTVERIGERVHPEDRALLAAKIENARAGRENPEYEIRLRLADDTIKYLRVFGRVIRHDDGRLECLGAVQDVTQRRLAEEALDKIRSELAHVTRVMSLGALTASIAHEVNQPLAGIVTNASTCLRMLAADPPNIDGARETARRTIRDGNRAAEVIARLRALFSRQATGRETVDLNEATREVLKLMFSDLLRNRVALQVEVDNERPLLVTGDRIQLQQVILNLVRNAADAMRDVDDRIRHLVVRAERDGNGSARLVVKDAGVGFAPNNAERLFDAFYTTKSDGTGIGLSLSRTIIESHGGRLWAETHDGPGATFLFSIPQLPADAAVSGAGAGVRVS